MALAGVGMSTKVATIDPKTKSEKVLTKSDSLVRLETCGNLLELKNPRNRLVALDRPLTLLMTPCFRERQSAPFMPFKDTKAPK